MSDETIITILIVDDSVERIQALDRLLSRQGYHVTTAETGERCLESLSIDQPDLVLLDIMLPGLSGLEVLKTIRTDSKLSPLPVLLLSSALVSSDAQAEGIELGANGYIAWPMPSREFLARVALALRNTGSINKQSQNTDAMQLLTPRQLEVVSLIAQGLSCKLIATKLGISIRTAETHRADAMKRLDLHNTAELVSFANQHNLT